MDLHLRAVPAAFNQTQKQVLGLRSGAEVDLRGQNAQDGPGPGVAPLRVGDHLALVNHRHVIAPPQLQLFRRGGYVGVLLPQVLLLAGGEAAVHPGVQKRLLGLQGQKAQRRQVHPRLRPHQPLKAGVGLSGIGAPQVKDEMAAQAAGLRVFVLGVQGDQKRQAGADGLGNVPDRPDGAQPLPQQLLCREILRPQQLAKVRLRLGGGELCGGLRRRGTQDLGISGKDLPGQRMPGIFAHPAGGPEKGFQNFRKALDVAALLQSQKLAQPGGGLRGAEPPPPSPGGEAGENGAVILPGQKPGEGFVLLRAVPCLRQSGAGPPHFRSRWPGRAGGGGGFPPGKAGTVLRRADLLLVPDPDTLLAGEDIARLGKQRANQLVGPPPPLQNRCSPIFSAAPSGHGAPSSRLAANFFYRYGIV